MSFYFLLGGLLGGVLFLLVAFGGYWLISRVIDFLLYGGSDTSSRTGSTQDL